MTCRRLFSEAKDALRRRIAGLCATETLFKEFAAVNPLLVAAGRAYRERAEAAERELAEVRDKVIEECAAAFENYVDDAELDPRRIQEEIRALKKEPTNG